MKVQSGSDYQIHVSDKFDASARQKMEGEFSTLTTTLTDQMSADIRKKKSSTTELPNKLATRFDREKLNKNSMPAGQLKKYISLFNSKRGHFDSPQSGNGNNNNSDMTIYQAPFDGGAFRYSYSSWGSDFHIDESTNRVFSANDGVTGNQIAISLGISGNTDSIYFDSENVSLLLINHQMKKNGYIRVVGFLQCLHDTDEVKILDHSQEFTFFGNVGLGGSETKDLHSLYLDIDGQNIGKATFYESDVVPFDTDYHDYTNLDDNVPSEYRTLGISVPVQYHENDVVPLWIGTGTESHTNSVGQEIRANTAQSWKLQEVWVITEN